MNRWYKHDCTFGEDSRDESFSEIFHLGDWKSYSFYYDDLEKEIVVERRKVGYTEVENYPLTPDLLESEDPVLAEAARRVYALGLNKK